MFSTVTIERKVKRSEGNDKNVSIRFVTKANKFRPFFFKTRFKAKKKVDCCFNQIVGNQFYRYSGGQWLMIQSQPFLQKKIGAFQKRRGISIIIYLPMTFPQSFPNSCSLPKGSSHFQKKATSKNMK